LAAQHLRHEGYQLAKTGDVSYLPGRNVLDPADHAAWQLGAHVQVQDEGAVGAQFELGRCLGRRWSGWRDVPLLLHAPDSTGRRSHARWNRGSIGVRSWLEDGFRVMEGDRCLTFGDFSLDLATNQLLCSGEEVALTPKAFAVLRRLVEGGRQVVSKEELLRAGWAKTHVSDGVLKVVIFEIRRALGDDPLAPRYIETVPRRGYRFTAPRTRSPRMPASAADVRTALVGRDALLAQLDQRLARARTGQRQQVFLSGEAGIGKTAVLDTFLARAASDPDLLIARGTCLEHYGAAEAYLPVLEAFGRLLRDLDAERVIRVLKTHAPTWLVQLPWLEEGGDREALRRELLGVTTERMLREMAEAVETLTATTPLLLVLEDLHWSDYSTLDLLGMLARRQEVARLLVIGSYRPVDVIVKGHPLRALIQELRVRRQCEDIPLAFLREPHVAAYLAQRFGGHAFPSELARTVHQRTDGNPLFMVRVVDELVALRMLEPEDDRWRLRRPVAEIARALPESLRALVEKQIDRLQPEAQRLLEAASVLGNEFTIGSVAAGLGADPLTVEERCDELARRGQFLSATGLFVRPDGAQVARYRFTHSLYPHAIAERVPAGWRMRLHQRVGEWLEHTYGARATAVTGRLAWHFEEAGDYHRAIRYLVLAAENAAGRFAYGDAIRVLQQARSLVHHLPPDARSTLEVELLQRIGDAHYGRGAWTECAEACEAAARAAEGGPTSAQVHALRGLIRPFAVLDPDRGIAAIEQAVRLSDTLDDPLLHARTQLLAAGIRIAYDTWRTKDWEICVSATETIHRLSDAGPPAFDRVIYAHLQVLRGDYAEALKTLEAGIPTENESTSIMVPMFVLSGKTLALLHWGRLGELLQLLRAGRDIAQKNGNEPWLFVFREAWLRTAVLDFAGACELCEGTAARSTAAYWRGPAQSIGGIAAGYAALEQGKYDDASRSFAKVLDPKKTPKFFLHWYWRMNAGLGLSNVWLASGNLRKARIEADRFLESALSTAEPNLHALAWELQARVAMAEKDFRGAEETIEKGLAVANTFEIPTTAWRVHATRSDLYRQAQNETAAEAERARAEATILALANSFAHDDPLRDAFLAAAPVCRIRRVGVGNKGERKRRGSR
jgi:DNA-binding winged helix-turn-helix (wHTH) protein/tetratricopeptide (TPR) repeat protein